MRVAAILVAQTDDTISARRDGQVYQGKGADGVDLSSISSSVCVSDGDLVP